MKHIYFLLLAAVMLLTGSVVMAQEEEAEKEIQRAQQAEQAAQMEEELQAKKMMLQEQQEKMKQLESQYADQAREFYERSRDATRWSTPYVTGITIPEGSGEYRRGEYLFGTFNQGSQTQLTLRKNFRGGTTNTSKGEFEVESDIRHFRCMINGTVRSGEIVVGVEYPDGKTFKELVINSSADVNFSQSISIKEGEEKKYTGTWKYMIKADKAEGNYMLQISTN